MNFLTTALKNLDCNMSIEINELIIRVTVNGNPSRSIPEMESVISNFDKKEIVLECVEIILEKFEIKALR